MKTIIQRVSETSRIPQELLSENPPFPKKAKIEITSNCDLKCFFCQHTYDDSPKANIDPTLCKTLIKQLKDAGVEDLGLFWIGEPMLCQQLPEYVAYAKNINISYVFITTNGRLATPDRLHTLFDAGLDSIKFSFNAEDRESYKKVCGVDAFDQVLKNLKQAKVCRGTNSKPAIYASSVFDPSNPEPFYRIKEMIVPFVDEHYPLRLYGKRSLETSSEATDIRPTHPEEMRSLQQMLPCWALFTEPHISVDGQMSVCYCDHDPRLYVGDLKTTSLKAVWHSEKFVSLRQAHLAKNICGTPCEQCIAYTR